MLLVVHIELPWFSLQKENALATIALSSEAQWHQVHLWNVGIANQDDFRGHYQEITQHNLGLFCTWHCDCYIKS